MKISTLIVVMGVVGALTAAMVTREQMLDVAESQKESFNSINTKLYASAWTNKSEQSWQDYLDQYNPDGFSEDYEGIFTPDSDVSVEPGFIYNSIVAGAYDDAYTALDDLFYFELEDQRLSFVMVYDLTGQQIYCGYATDFPVGVDPCSDTAKADFQDDLSGFLTKTVRSKRQVVRIDDLQGVSTSTFNQTLIFPIKGEDRKPMAVAIMGRNVFSNLELFEEEYGVRTAISAMDADISLEQYGIGDEGDYAVPMRDLISRAKELLTENSVSQTAGDEVLRHSMTALPISVYSSADTGRLLIFTDQDEIYTKQDEAQDLIYMLWAALIIAIAAVLAWVTTLAFRGILKSIDTLNNLTEQQQTNQNFEEIQMPTNTGLVAAVTSDQSEVPQLISALTSYKEALLANRQASRENRERRRQRDEIIAQKMRVLADQMEGEAKESMLRDVEELQTIDENASEEEREAQSVELMSTAFSKMSDEVNNLIDMKTADAITARDEAMDAKEQTGRFFNNMSHELRTPLNAIIGYSEILYEDCEDEGYDDLMPDLSKITNSGKHLLELVNEILDIGKIQSGKMEFFAKSFDLGETLDMVRDISSPLADKNGNKFVIDFPDDISGTMYTDEGKLRQNLTNLLSNAFKFTENGTVTLTVSESVADNVDMVDFTITDTGKGMTEDFLETIFDEYSQQTGTSTSNVAEVQKSTGLGMAILAKYVEMAGGTIRVESELGVGSTFHMSMPRRYADGEEDTEQDELAKAIQNLKSDSFVVMIDDDKNMHDVAKRTLGKAGINVIGAMDGEKGLSVIRENKPALILLDVYMPGREGWSILTEIKADPELKDIPVCMVTQLNEEDYAKSLGANGYFTKPIERETFVKEVLKLLDTNEGANQTILVIDDDSNTRDLLKRILSEEGFDPQTAKDGVDGLEVLDHLNTIDKSPSLIVLDISMPRMDGFQFLDAYSEKIAVADHVPVIIFSGKDMTLTQREFLNNFENVIGIFAKGDLPNLANFIQQHRDEEVEEKTETKTG